MDSETSSLFSPQSLEWRGAKLSEIEESFALMEDWEERYALLLDLAKFLPAMNEALKTDENFVRGCTSRVWMVAEIIEGKVFFIADSDAHLVRGLIGLLMAIFQGREVTNLQKISVEEIFENLGLQNNLSPNRRNGFFSMVERLKQITKKEQ